MKKFIHAVMLFFLIEISCAVQAVDHLVSAKQSDDYVTIAILVKDKAHLLPLFLACIEQQTWPAEQTYLYIRTNNNNDNSVQLLKEWIQSVQDRYALIFFDDSDIEAPVHLYGQHEWNAERFKALGKIRQLSVDWALQHDSHYFVVDCDNFIKPDTIEAMMQTHLAIVAPLLVRFPELYANYHAAIDEHGYFKNCDFYFDILYQKCKGLIQVPVVHCTYFIRKEYLHEMSYDDGSCRYEYVIFSENAREKKIDQYVDNRKIYGYLTFATDMKSFLQEPWLLKSWLAKML